MQQYYDSLEKCLASTDFYKFHKEYWENRDVTNAEIILGEFLKQFDLNNKSILHIGNGKDYLYKLFKNVPTLKIDGITVGIIEYENSLLFNDPRYRIFLFNKNNPKLDLILGKYDFIIDVNLFSYKCCEEHGSNYFKILVNHLNPNGLILTHTEGLFYINSVPLEHYSKELNINNTLLDKGIITIGKNENSLLYRNGF